jgi:hypothetical protein
VERAALQNRPSLRHAVRDGILLLFDIAADHLISGGVPGEVVGRARPMPPAGLQAVLSGLMEPDSLLQGDLIPDARAVGNSLRTSAMDPGAAVALVRAVQERYRAALTGWAGDPAAAPGGGEGDAKRQRVGNEAPISFVAAREAAIAKQLDFTPGSGEM